ncbi:MAG: ABC transporter ATP-binding protein [Lachnospiraceae bacterium]|nr:ABC transporter ATP-binding protein [Lachnospiraceae bacterium]
MIKLDNVSKGYGGKRAIENINLSLAPGQIHGVVGENGAGKTTLIKCMAGIYKADSGKVTYHEEKIYGNINLKGKIGYISDSNDYISGYTVDRMIKLYETCFPRFDKEKFTELNKRFKLEYKRKIETMSKGQKMRLAFMLELAKKPEYLLMDEPTSGLDPVAKKNFYEILIEEVERENIGVLISSHNLNDLEKLCDVITILEEGKVFNYSELDQLKNSLTKVQAVFESGVEKKLLSRDAVVKCTNVGNVFTLVVEDYDESKESWLKKLGAGYIEVLDMSLEELYITLKEREGAY